MNTTHKNPMRILIRLLPALLCLLFTLRATAQFAGGSGSPEDPWLIATAEQLDAVHTNLAAHFRLAADIDLGAAPWNAEGGWVPIGTVASPFTGTFDGAGFIIRNLTINRPSSDYQGLFSALSGAMLRNLRLESAAVNGDDFVGALTGQAVATIQENIQIQGAVTGDKSNIGGLAGYLNGGAVTLISVSATVSGVSFVGGLAGQTTAGVTIRHCCTYGSVTGEGGSIGGLVGYHFANFPEIADCYSRASVTGASSVGGLVGYMYNSRVHRSYSCGAVSGSGVGGLLGSAASGSTVNDCYWDTDSSGQTASVRGTGLTSAQMRQKASFASYNFNTLWRIEEGLDYPAFQDLSVYSNPQALTLAGLDGDGTEASPYLIGSGDELNVMRQGLSSHYRLTNDIDLAASVAWNDGLGWEPVGLVATPFTGTLDGAGYTIRNLSVNRPASNQQGLFGTLSGATVRNLRLENVNVQGYSSVGALAGQSLSAILENIHIAGEINGLYNYTGGLTGYLSGGSVSYASVSGTIRGMSYTGGLAGQTIAGVTIRHCCTYGSVTGEGGSIGGLVGYHYANFPEIADCYSRASVTGASSVGGLVGYMYNSRVHRSYSCGAVSGSASTGGFLGAASSGSTVNDCYWDTDSSGQTASVRGTGLSSAQMRQQASFASYNFNTLWRIEEGIDYPAFQDLSVYSNPQTLTLADLAGAGTEESPYLIGSAVELNVMRQGLTSHYRLAGDIDMSASVVWNNGLGWEPVGLVATPFTGTLDGAGFTIRHLCVNRPAVNHQGLFGTLSGATLRNLRLENVNVQGYANIGAVTGQSLSGALENISVSGDVLAVNNNMGGVTGYISGGGVNRASVSAAVRGATNVGGIAGYATNGAQIRHACVFGAVTGTSAVGGVVGYHYSSYPEISDCYSHASVTGNSSVGGVAGFMYRSSVHRSYSCGRVTGVSSTGGLLGSTSSGTTITDSYWDTDSSGQTGSAAGTGLTTAQMRQRTSFENYNFYTLWRIEEGAGYPEFQDIDRHASPPTLTLADLDGAGTEADPYLIGTAAELNTMRLGLASYYRMVSDIDMSSSLVWNGGRGWEPVGTSATPFTGTLDGGGFTIRNLTVNRAGSSGQGFFGTLGTATVQDLEFENISVRGEMNTGGIAGVADHATLDNIRITGEITGAENTGGVLGYMLYGRMTHVSAAVAVKGANDTGGIAGECNGVAEIWHAFSIGSVRGGAQVGGLVGNLFGSSSNKPGISHSFSKATVHGVSSVGGACGYMYYSSTYSCYSSGTVGGTDYLGGFLGRAGAIGASVTDCYWDTEASGQPLSPRGTGLTTAQMRQQASFSGWDFTDIWDIDEGIDSPFLRQTAANIALTPVVRWHRNGASTGHAVAVVGNTPWSATTADGWITITDGAVGTNSGEVVYSVAANAVPALRSGTITVSNGVDAVRTFTVYQGAELAIAALTNRHVAAASDGHAFVVSGNVEWTAQTDADWIGITSGGSGSDTGSVVYAVAENLSLEPRTNLVVISGGGITCTGTVIQAGALHYLEIAPEWREHAASGATDLSVAVTANTAWTATNDVDWITVTAGNAGVSDGEVTYSVEANTGRISRLGHVVITDGERTHRFRVNQVAAGTVIITLAVDPPFAGTVAGSGNYFTNQSVAVRAYDSVSHTFACWNDGSADVSSNAVYTFAAASDQHLTAKYRIRTFAVTYLAGTGGSIAGEAAQIVDYGSESTAVIAQPEAGAVFHAWSDGRTAAQRSDTNVTAIVTVTAHFRSVGGADLDWYAARGITPGAGEDWSDVDARAVPDKGTTLLYENIADTDPDDPDDLFRVLSIDPGPPAVVTFAPASTVRVYTLQGATNLINAVWSDIPGQGPRPGTGGQDAMNDNAGAPARFYRVKVEIPQ